MAGYLLGYQLLPYDRCAEAMADLFGCPLSPGTLATLLNGYSSYDQYGQCHHAQCNAHILRELNYVIETSKARWAAGMKELLLEIKSAVDKAREGGRKRLPPRLKAEFRRRYDEGIEDAKKLYGTLQRRGRMKGRKSVESPIRAAGRKLACRLEAKREEVLLFMRDFAVPFDNNQAERDLRMLKVKQKISGCFRTERSAAEFCRLRGYVSTMKKQGHSVKETIKSLFAGKVLMPALRC